MVISWIAFAAVLILGIILTAFQIRPSELNIPTRYTAYGTTNIYNDAWYYLISFIVLMLFTLVAHTLIGMKLFDQKGIVPARAFMVISIAIAIMMVILVNSVLGVATLLQ